MSVSTISARELHDIVQSGQKVELIDVRTPIEFREAHVDFARNVPLDRLDPHSIGPLSGREGSSQPLYMICRSGSRGKQACEKLMAAGFSNAINVEGGNQAWMQADLPIVRGPKAISLERQVRIAAGLLVFLGSLLSYFVHPYWMVLPAFVGAGLMFSGITDTCGMGMLLAKMPWNRVAETPANTANSGTCQVGGCN